MRCHKCGKDSFFRKGKKYPYHCIECNYDNINDPIVSHGTFSQGSDIKDFDCGGSINLNKPQSILPNLRDLHNRAIKFAITKDNKVDWNKRKGFKGSIWDLKYKNHSIEKGVRFLIIHYDKRCLIEESGLVKADEEIVKEIVEIANEISHRYNFEIDPKPIFHRIEVKTDIAMNRFVEPEAQVVYNSPYNSLELKGKNAISNTINLTQTLLLLNQTVLSWNENVKSHLEATNRWEKAAIAIEKAIRTDKESLDGNDKVGSSLTCLTPSEILIPLENLLKTSIKLREAFQ